MKPRQIQRKPVLIAAAFAAAGAVVSAAVGVTAVSFGGAAAFCAKQILCLKTGYEYTGAVRALHLTGSEDFSRGFTAVWETAQRQSPPKVRYRAKGQAAWSEATGRSRRAPANGVLASQSFIHRVAVSDLTPGETYEYQVSWDPAPERLKTRDFSVTYETRTLANSGPARFAFIADICLRDRPAGNSAPMDRVIAALRDERVDLILGGGDYACADRDGRHQTVEPAIQQFFEEWRPVFASTPFIAQYGNHECCVGERTAWWRPRLDHAWAPSRTEDGLSFAFDLRSAHVVGLYGTGQDPRPEPGHADWLAQTVRAARGRGQRYAVVFSHGPIIAQGRRHPPQPEFRAAIAPVLEAEEVDLHLSAHDMAYERTAPLRNAAEGAPMAGEAEPGAWPGVVYAKVSPGGRRALDREVLPPSLPNYVAAAEDDHFYYAVVTVTPDGPIDYVAYRIDDAGARSVVDQFVIERE